MTTSHNRKSGNQATAYYDQIAEEYDSIQEELPLNKIVRKKVKERFLQKVKGNTVIDFGGGTGADLEWLVSNGFRVYFYEPSEKMKAKAIRLNEEKIKSSEIIFLSQIETDFMKWETSNLFLEPVDAVLANFSVLNNVEDIESLFKILAKVVKPEGAFIATILRPGFLKFYQKGFLKSVIYRLKGERIKLSGKGGAEGFTFIYTILQLRNAAQPFFKIDVADKLHDSDFIYVELTRTNVY